MEVGHYLFSFLHSVLLFTWRNFRKYIHTNIYLLRLTELLKFLCNIMNFYFVRGNLHCKRLELNTTHKINFFLIEIV